MNPVEAALDEFKNTLSKGNIQKAYKHIFSIFNELAILVKKNSEKGINVGSIYHGYLDMSYLPITTNVLKENGLKTAVVFDYDKFCFEVWLCGMNKKIQKNIWEKIKEKKWNKYELPESIENEDSIVRKRMTEIKNYANEKETAKIIWTNLKKFVDDSESFLNKNI